MIMVTAPHSSQASRSASVKISCPRPPALPAGSYREHPEVDLAARSPLQLTATRQMPVGFCHEHRAGARVNDR